MARIRTDAVQGELDAAINSSATTISSPGLAKLATVSSPDVALVCLFVTDANGNITASENVYVTAHIASATTATVTRAGDGTTALSWGVGSKWSHGFGVADVATLAPVATTIRPSGDATGATDSAAITAAAASNAHVVLSPGAWYLSGVTLTGTTQTWIQGSGPSTVVNIVTGDTAFTLNDVVKFNLSDMLLSGGAFALNVVGAADSHFWNLYITGQTSGGIKINGDHSTEQHWADVVLSGVGGIGFDYERTTNADMGGMYLDRVRIIGPTGSSTHSFQFKSTSGTPPNINLFMNECVGDNYPADSLVINNCNSGLITTSWFTTSSSAGSGTGAIHLTGASIYNFVGCHTVQASSTGTAFGVLLDGSSSDITIDGHTFAYNVNTALGLAAAGTNIVLGSYYNSQPTLLDTPTALSTSAIASGPKLFYTNGGGGAGNSIALVDSSNTATPKYIRNAAGAFQILNAAFSASIFSLSDAGLITTPLKTTNSTIDDGSGNLVTGGSVQAGGAGVRMNNNGSVQFLTTGGGSVWGGSGAPAGGLGSNGDYYHRTDTPGTANQRIYVKSSGSWVGIL